MKLTTIIFLLLFLTSVLKAQIIYFDIKNQKAELDCKDRTVFILNHSRIICKECVVRLYKKIKKNYPNSIFIVYLNKRDDLIMRLETEKRIEDYLKPAFFIYGLSDIELTDDDFLTVFKKCKKSSYKEKNLFYKNGKLKKISLFDK